MNILTVIGARPQFIKAAVVSRALRAKPGVREVLVHTGQHYDPNMSDVFFQELEIPQPDHHLGIGSGPHGAQTGRTLEALERVLVQEQPDWLLIYGDTNSTLAGALAAAKLAIPIIHVEAGLRSFNPHMPEEINRILADRVSSLLAAPTEAAVANLRREGISPEKIHLVGDVMFDAALFYGARADARSTILGRLGISHKNYILATIHRAANTDDPAPLHAIFAGLGAVARDVPVVLPLHPRTRAALQRDGMLTEASRHLRLIEPVGYLDMVMLEKHALRIVTDSGGVQKEAFFHRVPCITLREETEWVELVACGWNRLVPPVDADLVRRALQDSLMAQASPAVPVGLYGEGRAAGLVAGLLCQSRLAGSAAAA
jgi:UDP-GlcNAc3NAcA epimerase